MPKRTILRLILVLIFIITSLVPMAVAEEKPAAAPSKTQAPVSKPAESNVNSITQAAVNAGVLSCTSRINQVSNFLTAGSQNTGAILFLPSKAPDQHLISISHEIPAVNGLSAYASSSFAPNQANGCGAMYETVVWWPLACEKVAVNQFGALKRIGTLSKTITMLDGGEFTRIFLLPAGSGCVTIKKELVQ